VHRGTPRDRRAPEATRQVWSRRNEDAMTSGNLVSRPAGAIPARSRVSPPGPLASLAAVPSPSGGAPLMRRHASAWAVGQAAPKRVPSRVPRALERLKATADCTQWASAEPHPAGSPTTARAKRTSQTPGRSCVSSGTVRSHGDPVKALRRATCLRVTHAAGRMRHRTSTRTEVGRRQGTTGAGCQRTQGVGGLHTSVDVGERAAPGPGRAKAVRAGVNFWRDP
jgi:hypothetical protein